MKLSLAEQLKRLPGPVTEKWPMGERFVVGLTHGTMSVEVCAPTGYDPQTPHAQDELYFVQQGHADLLIANERFRATPGDVFFVAAGVEHRFENISEGFATWVVFWGPPGGEGKSP